MKNRKYFLVDRNVVSIIKNSNSGTPTKIKPQLMMLKKLRKIDSDHSFITPLVSIIEGQIGKIESDQETRETAKREANAIKTFFRHAHTDADLILGDLEGFVSAINDIKCHHDNYYYFIKEVCKLIFQPISKNKLDKIKINILSLAEKSNIQPIDPVVICSLSVLYGCKISRCVLKPKQIEDNSHNSLSDIRILTIITDIILTNKNNSKSKYFNFQFLTLDTSLSKFLSLTKIINIEKKIESDGKIVEITYNKSLFPYLTEKEYINLFIELNEMKKEQ